LCVTARYNRNACQKKKQEGRAAKTNHKAPRADSLPIIAR
jgi:hypothetical protein